mmetsp:Transcript_24424/g.44220  ORF Transcript_24424/g.44220 Transcript_24424/m.44220 type:complete len:235 (+) Transcript_24424:2000-2704(+)
MALVSASILPSFPRNFSNTAWGYWECFSHLASFSKYRYRPRWLGSTFSGRLLSLTRMYGKASLSGRNLSRRLDFGWFARVRTRLPLGASGATAATGASGASGASSSWNSPMNPLNPMKTSPVSSSSSNSSSGGACAATAGVAASAAAASVVGIWADLSLGSGISRATTVFSRKAGRRSRMYTTVPVGWTSSSNFGGWVNARELTWSPSACLMARAAACVSTFQSLPVPGRTGVG